MEWFVWTAVFFAIIEHSDSQVSLPNTTITFASSFYDDKNSSLASDPDPASCFQSGYESHPWWKADLGEEKQIRFVKIYGLQDLNNIEIKVGNQHKDLGEQGGHEVNEVCARWLSGHVPLSEPGGFEFSCAGVIRGRFLSVETHLTQGSLVLCHVEITQ